MRDEWTDLKESDLKNKSTEMNCKYITVIIHKVVLSNIFWKYWVQKAEMIGL